MFLRSRVPRNTFDNTLKKLKPNIEFNNKSIFLGLLLFVIFSYLMAHIKVKASITGWSELWLNVSAGGISSIITIFFIDHLINRNRTSKLVAINKDNHFGYLTLVRSGMVELMLLFGYITDKEQSDLLLNAEEKFQPFLSGSILCNRLDEIKNLNTKNVKFIKELNSILHKNWRCLEKAIEEFKPHPDPNLEYRIKLENNAYYIIRNFEYFLDNDLKYKLRSRRFNKNKHDPLALRGIDRLWKLISTASNDRKSNSYKIFYLNSFKLLLELAERCNTESIYLDL